MDSSSSSSSSSALAAIKSKLPASLQPDLDRLQTLAEKRTWHQLTNTLQAFLANPDSHPVQIELYQTFVKGLASKLDKRRLVEIATTVAGQYEGACIAHDFIPDSPSYTLYTARIMHSLHAVLALSKPSYR